LLKDSSTAGERELRLILDSFPGLAAYIDRDFRYRLTNRTFGEWFGRPSSEFIGRTIEEAAGTQIWESVRSSVVRALKGERTVYETRLAYREDYVRDVRCSYVPDFGDDGQVQGIAILICDITEQKAAEEATQRSEERYRALVEASSQFVWITEPTGTSGRGPVNWWNELTGQAEEPRSDWHWLDAVHIDDRERVEAVWRESISTQTPYDCEYRLLTSTGEYRHFSARGVPIWNGDGSLREFVGTLKDITDQKLAERAQHEIEQQLTLLIEASGTLLASPESQQTLKNILGVAKRFITADAVAVWRRAEDQLTWHIVAMSGLSENYSKVELVHNSELQNQPIVVEDTSAVAAISGARQSAYAAEGIRSVITVPLEIHGEIAATLVFYYRTPHHFPELEIRVASALGNLAGAALGTADLYAREADLRRRAQQQGKRALFLAEAGQLLSSSLDYESTLKKVAELAVPVFADLTAIDLIDPSGEVRRVVVHAGSPEKIALAYQFREAFPALDTDLERIALRTGKSLMVPDIRDEVIVERSRGPGYLEIVRRLGPKSLICVPLTANNRTFGIISFVSFLEQRRYTDDDLAFAEELAHRAATAVENARLFTASQESEEALRKVNQDLRNANEDLNQFAYSASHDLQEPLRILSVYSQLLERDYGSRMDGRAREYLGFLVDGSKRMQMLLRDLLAYIQVAGGTPGQSGMVDAASVVEMVKENLKKRIAESGATIVYDHLPQLRMEEIHLMQLLQNLIGNAIKYRSEAPPRIEVSAERAGSEWLFRVEDNGIGIPARYRSQVFGIFKRLHTREQYPGTGIGLAICQKIVERYGGKIWVDSEDRAGSIFCFKLPA
jgi:PAS domain S-box-containing protein